MTDTGAPAGPAASTSPTTAAANPLIEAIASGRAPRAMRLAAARGALPLGRSDMFRLLVTLVGETDEEIRTAAERTLEKWPSGEIERIASDETSDGAVLAFLLSR